MSNAVTILLRGAGMSPILAASTVSTDRVALYRSMANVFLGLAILFLVLSVLLFFYFRIPQVYSFLTGRAQRKSIQQMQEENARTGMLRTDPYESLTSSDLYRTPSGSIPEVIPPGGAQSPHEEGRTGRRRRPSTRHRANPALRTGQGFYTGPPDTEELGPQGQTDRRTGTQSDLRTVRSSGLQAPGQEQPPTEQADAAHPASGAVPEARQTEPLHTGPEETRPLRSSVEEGMNLPNSGGKGTTQPGSGREEKTTLLNTGSEETTLLNTGSEETTLLNTGSEETTLLNTGSEETTLLNSGSEETSLLNTGSEETTLLNTGSEETTLLNTGSEETTLLNAGSGETTPPDTGASETAPPEAPAPGETVLLTPEMAQVLYDQPEQNQTSRRRFEIVKEVIEIHTDETIDEIV